MAQDKSHARTSFAYNPRLPTSTPANFYEAFASAAARFGDRVAVEMLGAGAPAGVRYRELADMAARTAAWLASRGIAPGDRVAILADNNAHWCAAYLGVLRAGAVAVPFDTNYTAAQVAALLADSGARAIFTSADYAAAVEDGARAMTTPPLIVMLGAAAVLSHPPDARPCPATEADPAVILYTSGTTSDPKGVVLTHGNLLAERAAAFRIVRVSEHDAVLSVLPLFHALAQMANLLLPFSAGARVVFLDTVNTTALTRALKERGITMFVVVPQFYYLLHRRIEEELEALPGPVRRIARMLASFNLTLRRTAGLNLGRLLFRRVHNSIGPELRVLVTGGARFDPGTNRALHALGFTIQQAYGLTECSGAATITRAGDLHFDAVGPPMPGVEIRIQPRDTPDADTGGPVDGQVLIGGPIVMQGYFNRPEQNAVTLEGGWLHTGDLGFIDDGGRLHVTGRSKDMIVLGSGKNIYPEEIEAHYERCPLIAELCVAGLARPGEPSADRLHALIRPDATVMRERGMVNIREQLRFEIESLSVKLPPHKRILGYDITFEPLPRTTTRKLKRHAVAKLLRERQAEAAEAQRAVDGGRDEQFEADPVAARIMAEMRKTVRTGTPLRPDAHLELDLGLDSMERVELLVHLTSTFQIEIGDDDAQAIHTVRDLVEAVRSRNAVLPEEREAAAPWEQLLHTPVTGNEFIAELEKPKRVLSTGLYILLKIVYGVAWLTVGLRASGRQHIPRTGPYLICPNHQSYADVFLLAAALPYRAFRRQFFVGAAEYFRTPFMRRLARALNVIPIDADANLVNAMQMSAEGLRRGRVLVLFPEGERSIDGQVRAFRKGAAILSRHLGAPMVPVAIDGAWTIWPRNQPLNWRALLPWRDTRARVQFGPPLQAADADYAAQASALRGTVVRMWDAIHAGRRRG